MMFFKLVVALAFVAFCSGRGISKLRPKNVGIIGGNETTIEDNPWQVSIQTFGMHTCGGSIIAPDTVLTAAHCIDPLMPLFYTVVVGSTKLSVPTQTVGISTGFTHDKYDYLDYDVGIVKLAENLTYSEQIQPITLATERPADDTQVVVTGYGVTESGGIFTSDVIRSVDVNIVNQEECNNDYAEYDGVTDRMICAAIPEGGKDACQGDSGGPLVLDGSLVGIVSWGVGCALKGYPGVYTSVADVREWIEENVDA